MLSQRAQPPADPVERAYWHLELVPEHFYSDEPEVQAGASDDDYDDYCIEPCGYCSGTGGDPWNDYILECPMCLGEGIQW